MKLFAVPLILMRSKRCSQRQYVPLSKKLTRNIVTKLKGMIQWHHRLTCPREKILFLFLKDKAMEANDEIDLDKLIQEELDALNLDEPIEENADDDDVRYPDRDDDDNDEKQLLETQHNLERQMQERLLAFENEVKTNLDRYEIDFTEIDRLLQKPIGTNDDEIQTNVARECGIERDELDQVCN